MRISKIGFFLGVAGVFVWIIFLWWQRSGELLLQPDFGALVALGRLSGLLAVFFVLMQFLLIGRVAWIERVFGLDRLSVAHHLSGFAAITLIVLHPLLLVAGYGVAGGVGPKGQFLDFIRNYEDVFSAFIALLAFSIAVSLSFSIIKRRLKYETWYFVHLLSYAGILLAFGHQLEVGTDLQSQAARITWYVLYAVVAANFIYFRFWRPAYLYWRHRFYVSEVRPEAGDATSVFISGRDMDSFRIEPGQFVIVRFLARGLWWQAHPFTVSLVPRAGRFRLTIKSLGDFTRMMPHLSSGTPVVVDGPHGVFTARAMRSLSRRALLIAGGIGITPIRALAESLPERGIDVAVLYAARNGNSFSLKTELDNLASRHGFPVHYVASNDPAWPGEQGILDADRVIRLVPDALERDVYLCGPKAMTSALRKQLRAKGLPAAAVHYEKFSFG